ncbi:MULTISPECIES: MEDS domain-containing protein [Nocardioides]|uniref:MEDS domain-containing protein n=1 Tax=Nocardioides vastitatis TaxID=2568655 RepID=A0ABW0ZGC7_9ACTN|nr:MEDS domain-containing protein [Nocardioides sp.]THJ13133.1 STAS domain-containing protein [Nocardioides sp.]
MSLQAGVVEDVRDPGRYDHLCWAFEDAQEFRARAGCFLAEGLQLGEQVWYVGSGDVTALEDELRELPGMEQALHSGAAKADSIEAAYPTGTVVDPAAQVAAYARATAQAVAAGFTGLRVAADATALVRTPEQLDAFARYEHLIDRYILTAPFSAMCAYQRSLVGDGSIAALACMHPGASADATPFWLHATTQNGCAAAIGGELDLATRDLLRLALHRADLQPHNGELVLDASRVEFMDHRSLLQLVEHARSEGHMLVLRTAHPGPGLLIRALGLDRARVEIPA